MELIWRNGKCIDYYNMKYNEKTYEFSISVKLEAETKHHICIAPDDILSSIQKGFLTLDGYSPKEFEWKFTTKANSMNQNSTGEIESQFNVKENGTESGQAEEVKILADKIKDVRSNLRSVSEIVHTVYNHHTKLRSNWAKFMWQGNSQFYADASNILETPYHIGCDGDTCWYYWEKEGYEKLVAVPFEKVDEKNVAICDIFSKTNISSGDYYFNNRFDAIQTDQINGQKCYLIKSGIRDVWIDAETYLPLKIITESVPGFSSCVINRFIYDHVNKPIPVSEFSPDSITNLKAQKPEKKTAGYNIRYLNVMDGSNGKMSVGWGRKGSKGWYGGGLNQ